MACLVNRLSQLKVQVQEDQGLRRDVLLVGLIDAFALLVISTLAYLYYRWWSRHPLHGQNKGSRVYPIIGSIVPYLRNRHRVLDFTYDTLKRLPGRTSRAIRPGGGGVFITANPANVEYILKTNFENYPKGNIFNENLRELLGDGIFNADDHLWKIQRKVASHEFSTRSLRDFVLECAARETSERLVPFLDQASRSGLVFDLQDILARFSFDNICRLGFGVDPVCLDISLPRVRFAEAFDRATLLSFTRLQTFPQFLWKVYRALNIGQARELRLAVGVIDEFAMQVIEQRRQELAVATAKGDQGALGGRSDLLSRFIKLVGNEEQGGEIRAELSHKNGNKSLDKRNRNDVFLRDIVISFVLAGRDTTTSALSWFLWLLSTHPHVEATIVGEISQVLSSRPSAAAAAASPAAAEGGDQNGSHFSFEELSRMQYLQAALTESMRLYPPVPVDIKTARNADVWPDGTAVIANSLVVYHPFAMGRLEELWGKDALEFRPDRWLNDGVFVPQSPYKYAVFQAGPRTCLGKDMVMLQMKLVSATVLRDFQICVPQDYKPLYVPALTLRMKHGIPVTAQKRTKPV